MHWRAPASVNLASSMQHEYLGLNTLAVVHEHSEKFRSFEKEILKHAAKDVAQGE